ncbi:MAG: xanthine dehydrogenase family protein molybdopterin-binding subunit [Pseudomonadota bacterium]
MPEEFAVLGKSRARNDALEKVTGQTKHVADIQLPGMLHAQFLRSPHAHAKIVKIDTRKAEALPGVRGVLTNRNVPKIHPKRKFEFLLDETVHCAGEEVAVVAADSKEIAEEALKLIEVEYKVLPAVFDAEEAMKPDAPLVHPEHGSNLFHGTDEQPVPRCGPDGWLRLEIGDAEKGFAEADYVLEGIYETPMQHNCSPMPRSVICQWHGDKLTCWADTQNPMYAWQDLAKCLGKPQSSVRLIAQYPVGCYGGKEPEKIAVLVALLAKKTGRPVKALFTREEDFVATHHRTNYKAYEKIGVKKDGTISAMSHRMITNAGRDCTRFWRVPACSAAHTCGHLYRWKNLKWEGCQVMTNIPDHNSFNGFGDSEAGYCVERLVDGASEKIGMDPVEFRLKNCAKPGDRATNMETVMAGSATSHDRTLEGMAPIKWGVFGTDFQLQECLRRAAEKAGWKEKWKGWKTPMEVNGARRRGIGVAIGTHVTMYRRYAAVVKMNHDGTTNVLSSATEIGQGCSTAMAQVVAETLGINYEDVHVHLGDTVATPAGFGNIGSGGTSSAITAAKLAGDDALRKLFLIAAEILEADPDDLEAGNRRIFVKGSPERGIPIADACFHGYQVTGTAVTPPPESIIDEKTGKQIYDHAGAATIAEVEVDTETGQLDVLRITTAHDCGRAINPRIIENQIDLSVVQANGWVRSEDYIVDESTGVVINPNLLDYKIMSILDMPKAGDLQEIIIESPCAWGAFGAKGMSETAMTTQAPAIANAIYNAIGVRINGAHLTPEKILEALRK